jgi:hypothetical protein
VGGIGVALGGIAVAVGACVAVAVAVAGGGVWVGAVVGTLIAVATGGTVAGAVVAWGAASGATAVLGAVPHDAKAMTTTHTTARDDAPQRMTLPLALGCHQTRRMLDDSRRHYNSQATRHRRM